MRCWIWWWGNRYLDKSVS